MRSTTRNGWPRVPPTSSRPEAAAYTLAVATTPLRRGWRFLVTVLLLLALPLQAAELARMVVCPPGVMAQGHEQAHELEHDHAHDHAVPGDHDLGDHDHGDHPVNADRADQADQADDPSIGHAHHGSGCCKACLAGCSGWVVTASIDWPAPGWTSARFPRLTPASVPEPIPGGLERPPRTLGA